jgi:leader peptidase (prepilin peptidase)/N-methyltransferase
VDGDVIVRVFGFLLGAVLGSFLNVCILRWPADQSVVRPPSRCPKCGYGLRWYDNIPVVSWLLLQGRCRQCRAPISIQYPLVELATALIWGGLVWWHGPSLEALRGAVFLTILLGIAMTDAREFIIPNEFSLGGLALGILLSLPGGFHVIGGSLFGAAVGFGLLWLVAYLGRLAFKEEAMGGGDVKMMAMVGAFTGWVGVLLTIFLGALLGSIVFAPVLLRPGKKQHVPFGIFLAVGGVATWFFGSAIVAWYRTIYFGR